MHSSHERSPSKPSYYDTVAALRREPWWHRPWQFFKRQRDSAWFWAVEVGSAVLTVVVRKEDPALVQTLAAMGVATAIGVTVWLIGFLIGPHLWRRDAEKLMPPFDDQHTRVVSRLLRTQLLENPPDEHGAGTALEALFQLRLNLAVGVTLEECSKLLRDVYVNGRRARKQDNEAALLGFLAELSMLHLVRREGDRFYLTEFGKDVIDRQSVYLEEFELAEDGTVTMAQAQA
jgi:hypothetical protein